MSFPNLVTSTKNVAFTLSLKESLMQGACLAQLVEHETPDLRVLNLSKPHAGYKDYLKLKKKKILKTRHAKPIDNILPPSTSILFFK